MVLLAQGNVAEATAAYERLHLEHPNDLAFAKGYVQATLANGDATALMQRLQSETRGASAASPVRWYMLGLAYSGQAASAGKPAQDAFRQASSLAPDEAEFHYRLGLSFLESDQDASALPPLQRAVELSPKRPELRAPLASALASSGDTTAAMKQIEALL
ncbi:MAG: hypothetical protein ACKVPX_18565, partial [Myxococcaceae bacterium]